MAEPLPRHIFLAPHYDDVALSCGGTVAGLAESGNAPVIVTIFGGTPAGPLTKFARDMHEQWGVGPGDAVAMRRNEERCAELSLGGQSIWLDFLDAIYRGDRYTSDPDIFGEIQADEAGLVDEIVATLAQRLPFSDRNVSTFYVPLAIGNHVDHQIALAAGRSLAAIGHEVWAYEDFPYAGDPAWRDSIIRRVSAVTSNGSRVSWLNPDQLNRKVEAVLCYASQLDIIFRHQGDPEASIRRYARGVGGGEPAERFWRL